LLTVIENILAIYYHQERGFITKNELIGREATDKKKEKRFWPQRTQRSTKKSKTRRRNIALF
jgi:hypothetical protein